MPYALYALRNWEYPDLPPAAPPSAPDLGPTWCQAETVSLTLAMGPIPSWGHISWDIDSEVRDRWAAPLG